MLDVSVKYSGQVDTSDPAGYPHGKARNVTVIGDGTGTPLEKDLVNDIFGLQQALLANAGVAPSGVPDKVGASQQLDAIKFLAEMSHGEFNVMNFGAVIDGVADDTLKLRACLAALAAAGGGIAFVPWGAAGLLRITDKISVPMGVSLWFQPGVQVFGDHATHDWFSWESSSATGQPGDFVENLWFEAAQVNTGKVFSVSTFATLAFRNCRCNVIDDKARGKFLFTSVDCDVTMESCFGLAPGSANDWVTNTSGRLNLVRTRFACESAYASSIVTTLGGELLVGGCKIETGAATGGAAIGIHVTGGSLQVSGGTKFDDGGGNGNAAIKFSGDLQINVDDSTEFLSIIPYVQSASALAAKGSKLKLIPQLKVDLGAGATVTLDNYYASVFLESTNASPPAVQLMKPLFRGQQVEVLMRNANASAWTGAPSFPGADGHVFTEDATDISGLQTGRILSFRFVAQEMVTALTGGAIAWVQVGKAGRLATYN